MHAHMGCTAAGLCPENIIIDAAGPVKIIDFGSVRIAGVAENQPSPQGSEILGTVQYTAPEYFVGARPSPKSDLFSLGVITYQMLTGRPPWSRHRSHADLSGDENASLHLGQGVQCRCARMGGWCYRTCRGHRPGKASRGLVRVHRRSSCSQFALRDYAPADRKKPCSLLAVRVRDLVRRKSDAAFFAQEVTRTGLFNFSAIPPGGLVAFAR
ncbi:MAG: hypothetical protein EKK41_09970 [Hyphomicrobiales bacterium]|nr:MAG: hypothetical protein EKK41_09970 [Hyphomicrobiales bacterium]